MNIKQELKKNIDILQEYNINEPILKSKIILANILKTSREYLLINEDQELSSKDIRTFRQNILKLCNGIPIQYITNNQQFMGLEFYINGDVLIPQPDTEILVEEIINICKNDINLKSKEEINILDLCAGSGAIGISIAKNIKQASVTLSDISEKALNVAKINILKILNMELPNSKIKIMQSDLFKNLDKSNKFDVIVSNPPYIETEVIKTLDKEVQNEPIIALDGGKDGLQFYKRIINDAYNFLNPKGYLCMEIGYNQKEKVIQILKEKYINIYSKKDLSKNDRIVVCNLKEN